MRGRNVVGSWMIYFGVWDESDILGFPFHKFGEWIYTEKYVTITLGSNDVFEKFWRLRGKVDLF